MKRRRLSDLYVRGKELSVNDGEGEPVKVWLAKMNELDRESALRRANAAKAKFTLTADDEESEAFAAAYAEIRDLSDREEVALFIIADDVAQARRRLESEALTDEEGWGKDDYLAGLLDAWQGDEDNRGLSDIQEEDADDPEVKRVWGEIQRFHEEITKATEHETERLLKDFDQVDIETLRRKATHRLLEMQAIEMFVREYRRQQIFYAVREPDSRHKRYFGSVSEIDDIDDELRAFLLEQYDGMVVERREGKDSPQPEDSSNSSEPEDQPSGPEAVPA
jgi:hypothetical protein